MSLIALLVGLLVERLATQLFHLRQLRWLDRVIDAGFGVAGRVANWPAMIPVVLLAVVLVLPVLLVILSLGDTFYGFPYMILAVVVLFFSLGPKDIGEEVSEYCAAIEDDNDDRIQITAKALLEKDVPSDPMECVQQVEAAVFVQANNQLFAVIFWFVLLGPLGPLGAWTYRVTDLIRRRAVFNAARGEEGMQSIAAAAGLLHGALAWVPARLTLLGYALSGHFDSAISAWRGYDSGDAELPGVNNENLLALVGVAAMAITRGEDESVHDRGVRGATAATALVFRLLLIWAFVIAAMTLYGWSL
jgi:AmpE protein